MLLSEKIQRFLEQLPAFFQVEVLDFIEYLAAKAEREAFEREKREWSSLSLSFAMRGMEDENTSAYTLADLKVVFG